MMSNMLSSSGNSPPPPTHSDECVYGSGMDWSARACVCVPVCARLCDPSLLIGAHLSGLCLIIYIQRGHFVRAASSAASHPPACHEEHVTLSCLQLLSPVQAKNSQNTVSQLASRHLDTHRCLTGGAILIVCHRLLSQIKIWLCLHELTTSVIR